MLTVFTSAASRWTTLDGERNAFITRCERYAGFTIPKVCPIEGYNQVSDTLQHDFQALGAQATNHIVNKLMLAMFAPSRPFFRLDPGDKMKAKIQKQQFSSDQVAELLSVAEKSAIKILDQRSLRPKLYEVLRHIVVTGNALLVLGKKPKVYGIKNFVCKRDPEGTVLELMTKERVAYAALTADARLQLDPVMAQCAPDTIVCLYKWVTIRADGGYDVTQWVNEHKLVGNGFVGKYTEKTNPYRAITWDLATGDDYGTGLVEDYAGDFAALSIMSESTVKAAILASEFRWLVNPAGQTKPEDLRNSQNGDALPGALGDINLVQSGKGNDLQVNLQISEQYIQRIGAGFLLQSAVTRDAERVTAEEIQRNAQELETGLGGAYSRIAVDIQIPLAAWLMKESGNNIDGADVEATVVTGLDAMSRAGDRDDLISFIQDAAGIGALPPPILMRLRLTPILAQFAAARGLSANQYLMSEDEVAQAQQQQQQQAMQLEAAKRGMDPNAQTPDQSQGAPVNG